MALFNRKKDDQDVLPAEVREYYKSEQRSRTGKAWLLAIITLLATFLIAAALFFGGRWVYRALFGADDAPTTTQEANSDDMSIKETSPAPEEGRDNPDALGGTTSSTNTATPPVTSPAAQPSTPSTTPSQLVNTGPGDEL